MHAALAVVISTTLLAQPAPPEPAPARERLMELAQRLDTSAAAGFTLEAFNTWHETLDPALLEAIATNTLPADATSADPIFDDQWWPAALTAIGVPRPAALDERTRDPWEWTTAYAILLYEAQAPTDPSAEDEWFPLTRAAQAFDAERDRQTRALRNREDLSPDALDAALTYLSAHATRAATTEALRDHPELIAALDESRAAIDQEIALHIDWYARTLTRTTIVVPNVPLPVNRPNDVNLPLAHAANRLARYLIARSLEALAANNIEAAAADLRLAFQITRTLSYALPFGGGIAHRLAIDAADALSEALTGRTLTLPEIDALANALRAHAPAPLAFHIRLQAIEARAVCDQFFTIARAELPPSRTLRQAFTTLARESNAMTSRGTQVALLDAITEANLTLYTDAPPKLDKPTLDTPTARALITWLLSPEAEEELKRRAPIAYNQAAHFQRQHETAQSARTKINALITTLTIDPHD